MKIRIEFIRSRSPNFKRALEILRALPGFAQRGDGPDAVYSVEVDGKNQPTALAVFDLVGRWRGTAFYLDGALVAKAHAMRRIFGDYFKQLDEERARERAFGATPSEFVRLQHRLQPPPG